MKTPRLVLLIALGTTLTALPLMRAADKPDGPPAGERGERMREGGERLAKELGLSEDQKAKMKSIQQAEKAELDALRESAQGDREGARDKFREIREKYRAQRDAVLTPEQKAKAGQMRSKMGDRDERKERREKRDDKAGT